jgi:hypothetical protein
MRFTYLGGTEFDDSEMPAAVTMFGVKFVEGIPAEVTNDHAIKKLKGNKYFREVDDREGAVEVLEAAKPKRGRPAKLIAADEAVIVEDAEE